MTERVETLLRAYDAAWSHEWESLRSALDGIAVRDATWQHASYRDVEQEAGWPPPGSVHWHVAHTTHCKRHYADVVRARREPAMPEPRPWEAGTDFEDSLVALSRAHLELRQAIHALPDEDLSLELPRGMTVESFVHMLTRHDVWHASQITVARRLARTRGDGA